MAGGSAPLAAASVSASPRFPWAQLHGAAGGADQPLLHVGLHHVPERHHHSPPEGGVRAELRQGHAGAVRLLHGVFHRVAAVGRPRQEARVQDRHHHRTVHRRRSVAWRSIPAAGAQSYPLFLLALFVLAAGITLLQVAANPFVAVLGPPETASSRLTLTQAINSLGTTMAPYFGSLLILSNAVKSPAEIRPSRPRRPKPTA